MSLCSRCGAGFDCMVTDGPDGGGAPCWCTRLPLLPREAYDDNSSCLCPTCLRSLLEKQERQEP